MMRSSSRVGAGSMLRAATQVASAKDPFSLAPAAATSSSSSSSSSSPGVAPAPVTAPSPLPSSAASAGGGPGPVPVPVPVLWSDWESVNHAEEADEEEEEEELADEFWYLDAAPRPDEVQAAICSLQQMSIPSPFPQQRYHLHNHEDQHSTSDAAEKEINSLPTTSLSTQPQSDWIEPSFHACTQFSLPNNSHKASEAFHLLKVNPSIQKMVFSLSSDKAVWDAVMKNEAVQEIKKSLCEGIADAKTSDNRGPVECIVSALGSIYSSTKTTVMELIDKVTTFVSNLVHSSDKKGDKESEFFADAVKSSLMVSVFVFLIVIVGRLQK